MRFLSINDIKFGLKRKLYEIVHHADGKKLIYNSETKEYVGHIDEQTNYFNQDVTYQPTKKELDLYGESNGGDDTKYNLF